jgi:hypothetical protein
VRFLYTIYTGVWISMNTTGQQTPQGGDVQPGREHEMGPKPEVIRDNYDGSGKLKGKVAVVTGGDSGIGRAVAVHFAREGTCPHGCIHACPSRYCAYWRRD